MNLDCHTVVLLFVLRCLLTPLSIEGHSGGIEIAEIDVKQWLNPNPRSAVVLTSIADYSIHSFE